jgi:hypothetical protein
LGGRCPGGRGLGVPVRGILRWEVRVVDGGRLLVVEIGDGREGRRRGV